MGRRALNGVAAGLAGSFTSRNNDIDGYWALGQLRSFVDRHQLKSLRLDLVLGRTEPDDPLLARVCQNYRAALARQLATRNIDPALVVTAELVVCFESANCCAMAPAATYGTPFSCSVCILDDQKKEHRRTMVAHCGPHDPKREGRRARR